MTNPFAMTVQHVPGGAQCSYLALMVCRPRDDTFSRTCQCLRTPHRRASRTGSTRGARTHVAVVSSVPGCHEATPQASREERADARGEPLRGVLRAWIVGYGYLSRNAATSVR